MIVSSGWQSVWLLPRQGKPSSTQHERRQHPKHIATIPDEYQLELLSEIQERRTARLARLEEIQQRATTVIRDLRVLVARYARGYQGPYRQFIWMLEHELRTIIIEIIALSAEEEIDRQIEGQAHQKGFTSGRSHATKKFPTSRMGRLTESSDESSTEASRLQNKLKDVNRQLEDYRKLQANM
ncbi:hypothetical protein N7516_009768 [Penicillium verrucosum]|uniref:uncharacterized protein n=1 Tax=Penicillium verrucosum TaxID=60171 RepID=UPI002544DB53|nr:uncharacterized protein N7516_009768 [Penicillium verrucosum]KAJ5922065.1 hypothetical protein N7516_009768 [Penicillium verrucosum]